MFVLLASNHNSQLTDTGYVITVQVIAEWAAALLCPIDEDTDVTAGVVTRATKLRQYCGGGR